MIENLIVITAGVAIVGYILDRKIKQKIQYESDTYITNYTRKFDNLLRQTKVLKYDEDFKRRLMQCVSGGE